MAPAECDFIIIIIIIIGGGSAGSALASRLSADPATIGAAAAGSTIESFLFRWNGTVWKAASFPFQGKNADFTAIGADPSGSAWAVGTVGAFGQPLSMRWDGKAWRGVPVPPLGDRLSDVTFIPGGTAWAVGMALNGGALVLHWSGRAWTRVKTPLDDAFVPGLAVTATSNRNAWAVGSMGQGTQGTTVTLIMHWNGETWS